MKPVSVLCAYSYECPKCHRVFNTAERRWPDGKRCPYCDAEDWKLQEQSAARQKWWAKYPSLRGACLDEVAMYYGDPVCLRLKATDGSFWEVSIDVGYGEGEQCLGFKQIEEDTA